MPSKKQYNLVNDDAYDSRIPLHSEEAFQHGINFHAKYIGTLDVPRPNSRVEIVAAMRRIRYEFKAKSIKKKKVTITISVEGVKVVIRKGKKKNQWQWDDSRFLVMHHPIYRIFYVSHDSQDLKIFSYIARDGGSNVFKCNVFKSSKKSQAMRIVRTVGQAFEVCHKLSLAHATSMSGGSPDDEEGEEEESLSEKGSSMQDAPSALEPSNAKSKVDSVHDATGNHVNNNNNNNPSPIKYTRSSGKVEPLTSAAATQPSLKNTSDVEDKPSSHHSGSALPLPASALPEGTPPSVQHQLQLMREQLEQQTQQAQAVDAQLNLLKDQLAAETTARMDAQAQNSHLLSHNRELLEHIRVLVRHIQDLERKLAPDRPPHSDSILDFPKPSVTENSSGTTTPSPASLHLPTDVCPSDVSPTLNRSVSASANPGAQDVWLHRSANSFSNPSTLGHQHHQPHQSLGKAPPLTGAPSPLSSPHTTGSLAFGHGQADDASPLSLPSSPSSLTTNLEDLLKQSALRINSNMCLGGGAGRLQEMPTFSPLPRLNPPPQKTKMGKTVSNLDLPPSTPIVNYNSPVSRSSSTSSSWTDSVPPPSLDSVRSEVLSWPPSSQANSLLRQYSLPSSQHSLPSSSGGNTSDNFVSQALKDLTKLNLFENNKELLKGIESHLNTRTDTLHKS